MNPFCDKYFTKTKEVLKLAGMNPIVKYRVFTRFDGIAALEPMAEMITDLAPTATVEILGTGTPFEAEETIAIIKGPIQDLVELETMYLQWAALPCYAAKEARKIVDMAPNKIIMDFAARHLYGQCSVALASYGAKVGGIPASSTDVGMNPEHFLEGMATTYKAWLEDDDTVPPVQGVGTTPHALIAAFRGDYLAMASAYRERYPEDKFVALIDYNNKEIDDSLLLLEEHGKHLAGVRTDTCGENNAQVGNTNAGQPYFAGQKGVCTEAVEGLRKALDEKDGRHVKVFVSSGFNAEKTERFINTCPGSFDGIGTGSFIPKGPTATADIFMVDDEVECKVGREWGVESAQAFSTKERQIYVGKEA